MNDCPDHDKLVDLIARIDERDKALELRLEKLNELRKQVETDRGQFLRFDVYQADREKLATQVEIRNARTIQIAIAIIAVGGLVEHFIK